MLTTIQGIYRKGKIEFLAPLPVIENEASVIVTFLDHSINLPDEEMTTDQMRELRARLATFSEEWDSEEMKIYDDYNTAKVNSQKR